MAGQSAAFKGALGDRRPSVGRARLDAHDREGDHTVMALDSVDLVAKPRGEVIETIRDETHGATLCGGPGGDRDPGGGGPHGLSMLGADNVGSDRSVSAGDDQANADRVGRELGGLEGGGGLSGGGRHVSHPF